MNFGFVDPRANPGIDFTLPQDGLQTDITLAGRAKTAKPALYVGTANWGRKEWNGNFYPEGTKQGQFLTEYARHFNCIEMNALFYSIPSLKVISNFTNQIEASGNSSFLFFPKFARVISHLKRLQHVEQSTILFLDAAREFKKMLGPCFLHMGENFTPIPNQFLVLENYLKVLPTDMDFFCEVQEQRWFLDPNIRAEYFNMLSGLGIGAVITDTSGRRDLLHMELPTPEVYIRFVAIGSEYMGTDYNRIDAWIIRIKDWLDRGLEKAYFMINPIDHAHTPELAAYTIRQFNYHLGANIPELRLIDFY